MAQPQPKVPHQNSNLQPSRSEHIGQTYSGLEGLDKRMSPEHGAGSPDIATEVNMHVTPDELFGPMSPRRGHGYKDDTINMETHEDTVDVFRNTDQKLPSPINNPEIVTSSSRTETSTKEGVVKDSPYTDQSVETDYGRSRSNQSKDSSARFKVSSMTVNRENVNRIRSRLHRDQNSQNGFSSRFSYLHVNIFDDNHNISDSKLDNTLLRLFFRNSVIGQYSDFDNPMESHNFSHSDFIGLEPVIWRVYPMMAAHKETLDREMDFIVFHLKPREIISRLYKDGILTSLDYNQLARTAAQGDRAVTRLLIRTLQRRGAKAYPALINALLASDYYLICERLSESEHELKAGTMSDRAARDWGNMKGGVHATPNRFHTPYMDTSPDYAFNWPVFPNPTLFSSNQNFPANETWPQANQKNLIDHMSPLYHTMPANHTVTPEGRDSLTLGTLRLEHRLNDVDRSLKTIHQDIASLRTDSRTHRDTLAMERGPEAYISANSPVRQSVGLGQQELLHGNLQQQMNDLKGMMKKVHEDVATLKGRNSVRDFPLLDQSLAGYQYRNLGPTTDGRRIIDAEMLDGHLGALRSEIKMLHDDVTALKTARSFSVQTDRSLHSTSRSFGKSSSRPHLDDSYLSPTRQSRVGDSSRDKSGSYSNVIPGPLPHASFPRYPSRYSPQFVHTGQYPDTARSASRADGVIRSSRNKTTADDSKSIPKSGDTSLNKSRNPDKRTQDTHSRETEDRPRSRECDMFTNNKDDSQISFSKTRHDDRLFPDNYSSDQNVKTHELVDKDVLLTRRSHDVLSPSENKDNMMDKDNSNDTYSDKNEDNIFCDIDEDSKFDNANYDEDTSRHRSKTRLDYTDSTMPNQEESPGHPNDNSNKAIPRSDTDNTLPLKKDARYTDERAVASRVPASDNRELPDHPYPTRVPEIVTPEKSPQSVSDPGSRNEISPSVPYHNNQQPKQKKKVRYSDTPTMDNNHNTRDNNERPKSRATNRTHNRAATKPPAASRDAEAGTSRRLAPPGDDQCSDDGEYVRLTTPTRILSPPHGLPFDRVTTPYKILRNPNSRKMTTWSKKQDRLRNTNRKGQI